MLLLSAVVAFTASQALASVLPRQAPNTAGSNALPNPNGPIVKLPYATFQGSSSNVAGVEQFLGMPFAQPPIGDLRLRGPVTPPATVEGIVQAQAFGNQCIQMNPANSLPGGALPAVVTDVLLGNPLFTAATQYASEDCLTINVMRPAGITANDSIPIVAWIYGGAFEIGSTPLYAHSPLIKRSVELGSPIMQISMVHRVNAFGFLGGKEIKDAGVANLGLQDQREGLRWIQKYAHLFGGDPTKVTIWGESAGAVSVGLQLVSNTATTEKNFRAAYMDSGNVLGVGAVDQPSKQYTYDLIVKTVGCTGAVDTLACLRTVPTLAFQQAMDLSTGTFGFGGLRFVYEPSFDSNFFTAPPQQVLLAGNFSKVPVVIGDCEDEGTLFSLTQSNITNNAQFLSYLKQFWLPTATDAEIAALAAQYPDDPAAGSPFNTGPLNQAYGQFKRIAAIQGDIWFQAPRRMTLGAFSAVVPTWSFLFARLKLTPFLGSFHASDIYLYGGTAEVNGVTPVVDNSYIDPLINMVCNLDPNSPAGRPSSLSSMISWPKWSVGGDLYTFVDTTTSVLPKQRRALPGILTAPGSLLPSSVLGVKLTKDTFRTEAMKVVNAIFLKYPF